MTAIYEIGVLLDMVFGCENGYSMVWLLVI
jgi:hypothetical protein